MTTPVRVPIVLCYSARRTRTTNVSVNGNGFAKNRPLLHWTMDPEKYSEKATMFDPSGVMSHAMILPTTKTPFRIRWDRVAFKVNAPLPVRVLGNPETASIRSLQVWIDSLAERFRTMHGHYVYSQTEVRIQAIESLREDQSP